MNPGRQGALGCLLNWSPKFYANVFLFFAQQLWGQYYILIGLNIKFSVETFQPLTYRMGNFVYHHWRTTSIYRPISYPFRSLVWIRPWTFSNLSHFSHQSSINWHIHKIKFLLFWYFSTLHLFISMFCYTICSRFIMAKSKTLFLLVLKKECIIF